jgi:hypothetical protein
MKNLITKLKAHNLSLLEFCILYQQFELDGIDSAIISLTEKGFMENNLLFSASISTKGHDLVKSLIARTGERDVSNLAKHLQSLFPEGKKENTPFYWRGGTLEVEGKLREFLKRYPDYTDEQIIDATIRYLADHEGNQYMQLLKYFIMKMKEYGVYQSALLSYLENKTDKPFSFTQLA